MFFITLNAILYIVNASWLCLAVNPKFNLSSVLFSICFLKALSSSKVFGEVIKNDKTVIMMIPKLSYSLLCSTAVALRFVLITGENIFIIAYIGFEDVLARRTWLTSAAGRSLISDVPKYFEDIWKKHYNSFKTLESGQSPTIISVLGTFCSLFFFHLCVQAFPSVSTVFRE